MPAYDSPMCTRTFLLEVFYETAWCPKYDDIKLAPCPEPPSEIVLSAEIIHLYRVNEIECP
jgi:hypothetical protein